ncbi:SRPBCC family protein [Acinetobacter sp. P8-3-8]|uniref:SRPBCC family protein n=1 Tax=Acinetobacter sp. P8-3-8 TaxID=1029823 RepID=UPI00148605E0|nr:SRPBCC family protein [Acinetobacter sp. P8-3-8]
MKMSNTVKLHRVFSAPAERVYRAFLDPDALVKWMPPHGFTAKVHHSDATVGGTYKMSFTNFSTGSTHSFGGTYEELIPNQRIRYFDEFDNPELAGKIEVIIELKAVLVGTEVNITQSGIPDVIPVEACYLGWQESLQLLGLLVNPAIPDQ